SKETSATPLIGIERRASRRPPIRSTRSGRQSSPHCSASPHARPEVAANEPCGESQQAAQGLDRRLGGRRRHGGARAGDLQGEAVTVGLERRHLEQDAGKSLHEQHASMSLVDLNRCGVGLMEIVSKPDLRSADEARAFLTKLRIILRYLGTCDGDMEKGSLRADVNVSVRRPGEPLGTRCEIKNVNSIRFVGQAIEYEARRQIDLLEEGGAIDQETRLFDPN